MGEEYAEMWMNCTMELNKGEIKQKTTQVTYEIPGTRMSGEATTSIGNSLINKYSFDFIVNILAMKAKGLYEGDD